MIHRVRLKNFYSIREQIDIDLTISGHAPENEGRSHELCGTKLRIPKCPSEEILNLMSHL
jgi:hypothetical protein